MEPIITVNEYPIGWEWLDNVELQAQFMDLVIEYMEETMNWPDPDDQETFEKQLL